jgi:hypothetical protein
LRLALHIPLVLIIGIIASAVSAPGHAARIKCWTNKDDVRECGNAVPPEYAQQGHETKSKGGLTVNKKGAARDADDVRRERVAKMKAQRVARDEKKLRKRQAVNDRVLLDSFATEEDVHLQHDRKMEAIASRISHSRDHTGRLEETLGAMQKLAADEERAGKTVSDKLLSDIGDVQRQVEETETFIDQRTKEMQTLVKQYQSNLRRYRYLKSGGQPGSPPQKS